LETDIYEGLRGYIPFPCGCKSKILVYEGTAGKTSTQCPICGKYAVFFYDTMSAERIKPARGAVQKLNLKKPDQNRP